MDVAQLAKIFKALSHPNRLELFLEILKHEESSFEHSGCLTNEIMERLKIGAPTVSHHLKELSNANLIITERQGKFLVARINQNTMQQASEMLTCPKCQES
jgi:DNA-binding transcriptional ArsR family regulator